MAATLLPSPIVRPAPARLDVDALRRALVAGVDGEVRFDAGSRAAYSTDASNYRQVPVGVVVPRTIDAAVAAVRVCARFGAPVLSRGGGTSLAGQTTNAAVVIDWTKHCGAVEHIDPETRTALVQPGAVLDAVDAAAREHGLMVGPKPAPHSRCTIGGMVGNNSCGSTAQTYGKTVDSVVRLEVLLYDGTRMWVGADGDRFDEVVAAGGRPAEIYRGLKALIDEYGDDVRADFPAVPRRVSGYDLDDLLPEKGFDIARALVGSESTLVTVLRAEIRLVPVVAAKQAVIIGYPDIASAADAAPSVARFAPLTLEAIDRHMVEFARDKLHHRTGAEFLPAGAADAWLVVEFAGDSAEQAGARADALVDELRSADPAPPVRVLRDPAEQALFAGAGERPRRHRPGRRGQVFWPGWEDAGLPPERLGDYLRDFQGLMDEFGYRGASLYGHFGQGCVPCHLPYDLTTPRGIEDYEHFVTRCAHLVASYGGSFSGEHGDGQARGALLPIMFGPRVVEAMGRMKALFDPYDRMNPGKDVAPFGVTDHLRLGAGYAPDMGPTAFGFPDDGGRFENAVLRCVGTGQCRGHEGGVMCPSYRATGEEEHSTRGRSRLLFEMMNGPAKRGPVQDGWRSTAVKDALDLCLACKGCKSDCPVNVDMSTYKAEFLHHHYRGRLRPLAHYSVGCLPLAAWFARIAPAVVNAVTHLPLVHRLARRAAGIDPGRPMPYFAEERFSDWFRHRRPEGSGVRGEVLLFPDTFTNALHPAVAKAAVAVLEEAGYRVVLPEGTLCCGLTWISTGQLDVAKHVLRRTARSLAPALRRGVPLVGLEPSCTAVFRSDGPELPADDPDVALLKASTRTFAELLDGTDGWRPPRIDRRAVVQPHCHQHAVLTDDADRRILDAAGIDAQVLGGCCGLAGNFGFERGHLDVSVKAAKHELLPAVNGADDDVLVLADGFSCRAQTEQLSEGRQAMHLAELLALGLAGADLGERPERLVERPGRPQHVSRRRIRRSVPWRAHG